MRRSVQLAAIMHGIGLVDEDIGNSNRDRALRLGRTGSCNTTYLHAGIGVRTEGGAYVV